MSIDFDGQAATITGTDSGLGRTHAAEPACWNALAAVGNVTNMDNAGGFALPPGRLERVHERMEAS